MSKSLLKELKGFYKKEKISMHIPGHKRGRGLGAYFTRYAAKLDMTELKGTDNLLNPTGILKTAQDNCAKLFGAEETLFLTGGSSLGLRGAILGCVPRGGKIIVDRTCHRSVLSAVALGGAEPIFAYPTFDKKSGLYTGMPIDEISRLLTENPDVWGAIITSPTYYGICSDIKGISKLLHEKNKFLIVDEAHGAHFAFNKKCLPSTAMEQGADICVQSAHKTLSALGQCSYLHIGKGARINKDKLLRTLRLIQTTSPSYMLMTSLDEAARQMKMFGKNRLLALTEELDVLKAEVRKKTRLHFADEASLGRVQDPTRLVVDFSELGISGERAEEILQDEYGIYAEMSDFRYVVLIPTIATTKREIRQLCEALCHIGSTVHQGSSGENSPLPKIELACSPSAALSMDFEKVPVKAATGRISANVVSACPPGAAVLVPGQRISDADVAFIEKNKITHEIEVIK